MTGNRMQDSNHQVLQLLFSGALAHLTHYLGTGCYRSAYLARMVLEQLVESSTDGNLTHEAGQLIEVLQNKADNLPEHAAHPSMTPVQRSSHCVHERRVAA